jgi:predicted transcriptional regulator
MLEALLADPAKAPLLVLLASNPGPTMTINQMARRTGASFGSVKGTLRQLGAIGLLTLERRHYRYLVQPTQRLRDTVARHVATDQAPSPSRVGG